MSEEQRSFLAQMSHDLRNPLSVIRSSTELLELQEPHTPEALDLLRMINDHVCTITDMLDARLDAYAVYPNTLPVLQPTETTPPSDSSMHATPNILLVVDDNAVAACTLSRLLELRGYTVYVAFTGRDALQQAALYHPDIIILDIGLPDIDGYEVARAMRESLLENNSDRSPRFIALTGYGSLHEKEHSHREHFDAHLTKPVGITEIEAALQQVSTAVV